MVVRKARKPDKYFCLRCRDKNYIIQCGCGLCENTFPRIDNNYRIRRYFQSHYKCMTFRFIHNAGYIVLRFPNSKKRVYEHRHVFEQHYKCSLLSWSHIHHINGNKQDNRIENLEGMTIHKHRRSHMLGSIRTEETRQKISKSHIGKKFSEEHRKNLSLVNTGKKLSEEHKRKIGESLKGKKHPKRKKEINFLIPYTGRTQLS